jgi:DNA-binding NarL/FixJ family response regulator
MKAEKPTVFVVDDSPVALGIITAALQRTIQCDVKGFTSAEECMYSMEEGLPDLILSDYYLDALYERKINGDQMLARIKKKYPDVPVIMYSTQNSVDVVIRLTKLGAADFILKEKDFIKTISAVTSGQIDNIKRDYKISWIARSVLFMMAAFTAVLIIVQLCSRDSVIHTIIGITLVLCIIAFVASNNAPDHQTYKDLN